MEGEVGVQLTLRSVHLLFELRLSNPIVVSDVGDVKIRAGITTNAFASEVAFTAEERR